VVNLNVVAPEFGAVHRIEVEPTHDVVPDGTVRVTWPAEWAMFRDSYGGPCSSCSSQTGWACSYEARLRNQRLLDGIFAQLTPNQSEVLRRLYVKGQSENRACRAMRITEMHFQAVKAEAERRFEEVANVRPVLPRPGQ
jgi:hypothetical protein